MTIYKIDLDCHDPQQPEFVEFLDENLISMTGEPPFDVTFRAISVNSLVRMIYRFYDTGHPADSLELVRQIQIIA